MFGPCFVMQYLLSFLVKKSFRPTCADPEGGHGVRTPVKNHKNIGYYSNTCPDPLKITKLPSQYSVSGHHRHAI